MFTVILFQVACTLEIFYNKRCNKLQKFNGQILYWFCIILSFSRTTSESKLEGEGKLQNQGKFSSATIFATDTKLCKLKPRKWGDGSGWFHLKRSQFNREPSSLSVAPKFSESISCVMSVNKPDLYRGDQVLEAVCLGQDQLHRLRASVSNENEGILV